MIFTIVSLHFHTRENFHYNIAFRKDRWFRVQVSCVFIPKDKRQYRVDLFAST